MRTPAPVPSGSLPIQSIPTREGGLSAASRRWITRSPTGRPSGSRASPSKAGVPPMARATAQAAKSGTRPSQVTDGPLSPSGYRTSPLRATVVQPQSSQRHTEPLARTSQRWFRAHAPRCRCARAVRHRPPAIGGQVPPPESLSVAAAENDLQSWLRTRESRSIRLGGSRTGTGLRVFALVGRTGSPTSMSPPTPLVKKPFAPQVSDAQIVQSIIERGIE